MQTDEWIDAFEDGMSQSLTGCYLTPMHQFIDNQPETAENQLELIPAGRWGHPGKLRADRFPLARVQVNGVDILADGGQNAGIFCSAYLVNFFAKCFQNSKIKWT